MQIDKVYDGELGVQVVVSMYWNPPEPVGVVEITPRWKAAAKQILRKLEMDDRPLTEVRAAKQTVRFSSIEQQFQLSYESPVSERTQDQVAQTS